MPAIIKFSHCPKCDHPLTPLPEWIWVFADKCRCGAERNWYNAKPPEEVKAK